MTQASLETLAVVAYKQPVTRGRVSAVRGVNCDGVIRTLAARGLIEESGSAGRPAPAVPDHGVRSSSASGSTRWISSLTSLPTCPTWLHSMKKKDC